MTVPELQKLAERHGFELACNTDGHPVLRKLREDASLPGDVKYLFSSNRDKVIRWFRAVNRGEWTKCPLCLTMVHTEHPMWESADPFWCEKGECPLKARE